MLHHGCVVFHLSDLVLLIQDLLLKLSYLEKVCLVGEEDSNRLFSSVLQRLKLDLPVALLSSGGLLLVKS